MGCVVNQNCILLDFQSFPFVKSVKLKANQASVLREWVPIGDMPVPGSHLGLKLYFRDP